MQNRGELSDRQKTKQAQNGSHKDQQDANRCNILDHNFKQPSALKFAFVGNFIRQGLGLDDKANENAG